MRAWVQHGDPRAPVRKWAFPSFRVSGASAFALSIWASLVFSASAAAPAQWIWSQGSRDGADTCRLSTRFELPAKPATATLHAVGDFSALTIQLNGRTVGDIAAFQPMEDFAVSDALRAGTNTLAVQCSGVPGPSAIAVRLELKLKDGTRKTLVSDATWTDDTSRPAKFWGDLDAYPWGEAVGDAAVTPMDNYEQWRMAQRAAEGTPAAAFRPLPGFNIERVRSAQPGEGSWISMVFDPQGRIIIAMEKQGLLRLTITKDGRRVTWVELIDESLPEVRGLAFTKGDLYANSNNHNQKPSKGEAGLYRLRDTDGNDLFDEVKRIGPATRTGGHGRNDITVGPDGMIYQMHGDSVSVPDEASRLAPPVKGLNPGDDRNHGHLIRTDPDGKRWEVVAQGLRNPFGIAFNPDGEAFTYDADAEHDMGSPWYRPTWVRHLVSGGDYGWRSVTGMWPPYFPDHVDEPPPSVLIGKGSPTAVEFGTRSAFPPAYQRALYIMDWAYGRILAVHLVPEGASYTGKAETFLRGTPANATDMDFGPDGALYFVTGGRGTQSGLYRVTYAGPRVEEPKPGAQRVAREAWSAKARQKRHALEAFHGRQDPRAIDAAWPHLDDPDPWIRHAARVALEHQPESGWQERALNESQTARALCALLSLSRVGAGEHGAILKRLGGMDLKPLAEGDKLSAIRTVEICLMRMDQPDPATAARVVSQLDALFPDSSREVNRELIRLLASLGAPDLVPRGLALMDASPSQEERMHYLYALRTVRDGWTTTDRNRYFHALGQMDSYRGGAGLPKFIEQIRGEALASVPPDERVELARLLTPHAEDAPPPEPRSFVKKWTMADTAELMGDTGARDFQKGKSLFSAVMCSRCHTLGGEGRPFGPDLSNVSSRFNRHDLLEAIIEPSRVVAENFRNVTVIMKDGATHTGQIAMEGDFRLATLNLVTDPLRPFQVTQIDKWNIETHLDSAVSPMPDGLLDSMKRDEVLDLLTFLESGGNPAHPVYQKN